MDSEVQRGPTSAEAAAPTRLADRGAVKGPTCETLKPEAASSPGENEAPGDVPQEGHVDPKPGQGEEEDEVFKGMKNISVWTYLYTELTRGYWLEHDEAKFSEKRKRVYTFMQIPKELEKFMFYGFFQCVDGFLYLYTLLPLRFIVALIKLVVKGFFSSCWPIPGRMLDPAQICDLLKGIILVACFFLLEYVDVSMMYHLIRGQAIIKLYIFFNMLEVADRLFSSLGQDILDSLFWTATEPRGRRREHFGTIPHLGFAILYVFLHAILVLFQATTLNVAFNSHNKALLTIMMSNNFVELKGSVFKKFEKNNLFQMSCSDVRERFHFMVLLMIVSIRNLTEFSWNMDHFWVLVPDIILMLIAEFIVDWVKHAFITKFNEIPSEVYKEYTVSIAYDVANSRQKHAFSDHVDVVSRRMGFIPIPVAVLLLRVVYQSIKIEGFQTYTLIALFYLCLFTLKVLISIVLLGKTCDLVKDNKLSKEAAAKTPPKSAAAPPAAAEKHSLMTRSMTVVELSSKSAMEEVKTAAGLHRRSRSVGRDLNVTFSNTSSFSDVSMADTSVTSPLNTDISMTKPMFSNSTVSLQSVGLNEEFIKDKDKVTGGHVSPTLTDMELKQRKPEKEKEPPKPLSEVDRYTMCSNRII